MQRGVQSHLFDTNITATWRTRTELPGFHWKPPWSKVDAGGFIKWWRRYCTSYHTITRLRRTWKRTGRCYLVQYRASQTCLRSCEFIDGQRLGLTRWLKDGLDIRPTHLSVRPREWASLREREEERGSEWDGRVKCSLPSFNNQVRHIQVRATYPCRQMPRFVFFCLPTEEKNKCLTFHQRLVRKVCSLNVTLKSL